MENQRVFYQMPGQHVELMYPVGAVKPLASSDSLEPWGSHLPR